MKAKTLFYCTECGNETAKWAGKCPACGAWNTIVEQPERPKGTGKGASVRVGMTRRRACPVTDLTADEEIRFPTGMGELDRVLGGGAVKGSLVLVGGAPGIGKSTLMLQICQQLGRTCKVLYVSGEESARQLKLRAKRLSVDSGNLFVLSETRLGDVLECIRREEPDVLIVDSIQTLYNEENESSPGSVSQVKDCTMTMMQLSKSQGITVFVVGHINKDGNIAGPKVLEHMVDCVLYFEGDPNTSYRLLRAAKNRFGSTNEIGVFEMLDDGLAEVPNPSQMLLEGRPLGVSGNCVACTMEGSRPILSEIQALATKTNFPAPRRACSGYDYNRMNLLIAVLEKRAGYFFGNLDVYVNIVGGIALRDTACDLAVCLSMVSSLLDRPVSDKLIAIGEVGLGGEVRSVPNLEQRLHEAERIGFERAVIPKHSLAHLNAADYPGMKLVGAAYIADAINALKNDRL